MVVLVVIVIVIVIVIVVVVNVIVFVVVVVSIVVPVVPPLDLLLWSNTSRAVPPPLRPTTRAQSAARGCDCGWRGDGGMPLAPWRLGRQRGLCPYTRWPGGTPE